MKKLFSAVKYLHQNKIMHRDLKPNNILLASQNSNIEPKIIDFGLAKYIVPEKVSTSEAGSLVFMAPEVLKHNYDERCDIWSLGCIMHVLITGHPPFVAKTPEKT
jgi:calcium-dependent protein kinase